MNPLLRTLVAAALLWACGPAQAQFQPDPESFRAFGEKPGLVRLVDDFYARLKADPRMAPFFRDSNAERVKAQLVDQFCESLGGPCRYQGPTMGDAHANMEIRKADFNALVVLLQDAMQDQGIAFRAQNRLLERLAPLHRGIVNTR